MAWLSTIEMWQVVCVYFALMPLFGLMVLCLLDYDDEEPTWEELSGVYIATALYPVSVLFFVSLMLYRLYRML